MISVTSELFHNCTCVYNKTASPTTAFNITNSTNKKRQQLGLLPFRHISDNDTAKEESE